MTNTNNIKKCKVMVLSCLFCFLSPFLFTSTTTASETIYQIGVVPQFEARRLHSIWSPILEYLTEKTGYQFVLRGAPSIAEFEKAFMQGEYDIAYMNPYHFILANQLQGYQPLVRDFARKLSGVLVVKKDSNIHKVSDLEGKKIAFPSPNALGAALQMRQELHDKFSLKIRPVYVKTHDSVYLNVLLGDTDAGGGVQKTLNKQMPQYKAALKVIHKTTAVSPHPITIHPRVPNKVKIDLQQALLNMGDTEEGKSLLAKIPMKKIGTATISDYDSLKKMNLERFYVKPK